MKRKSLDKIEEAGIIYPADFENIKYYKTRQQLEIEREFQQNMKNMYNEIIKACMIPAACFFPEK